MDNSYQGVMDRKNQIMMKAIGMDYTQFQLTDFAFDYEKMMSYGGYTIEKIREIQKEQGVGNTPLYELKNITELVRKLAPKGKGARIFLKDEASNPSGSFKARRAAISVFHAKHNGYKGVIAATSGNYGAAVASQAAMQGIDSIIVQEAFDSKEVYQPEIMEKGRACEAYGSEVIQLSVGPELFYVFLKTLEDTGFFNASLYTPFGIAGIETLGLELAEQVFEKTGRKPDKVVVTHAGGGNLTGTARGLIKAGCKDTEVIGASIDLQGLHMASDNDFNKKSFTTGHTGFGVPFATWPDRADVPKNAARSLRYMDRYVTVSQGQAFYVTEMLAVLEGLERGPAGNTSLAAAIPMAMEMDEDQIIVVQETEYTGAGKHINAQLAFAKQNGIEVYIGDPKESVAGKSIVLPEHPSQLSVTDFPMDKLRSTYLKNVQKQFDIDMFNDTDWEFLQQELNINKDQIEKLLIERG